MIVSLVEQLARQQEQLDELKDRAGLNSRNSSKPPSSDGPQVGKRVRSGTGRKRGGQVGHPGAYRALVDADRLTEVVEVHAQGRCECGAQVVELEEPRRHQVFDLPQRVQAEVSEYRLYRGVCAVCGARGQAAGWGAAGAAGATHAGGHWSAVLHNLSGAESLPCGI